MKQTRVWRYNCEFCNKKKYSASAMRKHESSCTANPNRACRMCRLNELEQKPIEDLKRALDVTREDFGMAQLRDVADGCPCCILAAIRQTGIAKWGGDPDDPARDMKFDFKAEMKSMLEEFNQSNQGDY